MNIHYNDNRARMIDYLWENGGVDPVTGKVWDNSTSRAQKAASAATAGTLGLVGGIGTGILPAMIKPIAKGFKWFNTTALGRAVDTGLGIAGVVHAAGDGGIKKTIKLANDGEVGKAILSGAGDALDIFGGAVSGLNIGTDIYKGVKGGIKGVLSGLHPMFIKTRNGWRFGRIGYDWDSILRKAKRNYRLGSPSGYDDFFLPYLQQVPTKQKQYYRQFVDRFYADNNNWRYRQLAPPNLEKISEKDLRRMLLVRGVSPTVLDKVKFVKTPKGYDVQLMHNEPLSELTSGIMYEMHDYQDFNKVVQGLLKIPENPGAEYKFIVPEDYKNMIQKNTQYVIDFFDGKFKPFGSSVGTGKVNLPHNVHDIDGAMLKSDFVKWRKAHPNVSVIQKSADTYGVTVNGNVIDVNVLRPDSRRTYELYRQFFPEEYSKAVNAFNEARNTSRGEGSLSDYINITPEQAFSEADPVLKTIIDSFEINPFDPNKSKHLNRPFLYLTFGDPKIIETGLSKFAKIIGGTERFPVTLDQLTDVQHNIEILKQMGYPADTVNMLAADPQRMKNALDYWYLQKTIQMRGVSGQDQQTINNALRNWLGEKNKGGANMGAGLNAVRYGNSGHGPIAGYSQVHSNTPIGLNLSLEDKINAINRFTGSPDYRLTPQDIEAINSEASKVGLKLSFNNCVTFDDVLKKIPVTSEGQKFLQGLGKNLNIQTLESSNYGNSPFVAFTQDLKPEHYIPLSFSDDFHLVGMKERLSSLGGLQGYDIDYAQDIKNVMGSYSNRIEGYRYKDHYFNPELQGRYLTIPPHLRRQQAFEKTQLAVENILRQKADRLNKPILDIKNSERVLKMFRQLRKNRDRIDFLKQAAPRIALGTAGFGSIIAAALSYAPKDIHPIIKEFCKENNIEYTKQPLSENSPFIKFIKQKYNTSDYREAITKFKNEFIK